MRQIRIPRQGLVIGALAALGVLLASRVRAGGSGGGTPLPGGQPDAGSLPANMRMDYRGQTNRPRGVRNNNPGNIKRGSSQWVGKVPYDQSTDSTFEQFTFYVYGVRAMIRLLRTYIEGGTNTIGKIITRWAPAADGNDPMSYTAHVANKTGIPADQVISFSNTAQIRAIVQAIADFENGTVNAVPNDVFDYAYSII